MLGDATVHATIAVKELGAGKAFYGEKLGLKQIDENPAGVMYESGSGKLFVYVSPTAGSGQATCAFWQVADVDAIVAALKGKGVVFEQYEIPGATTEGDVHVMGDHKAAWFKDPDGNILSVSSM